MIIRKRYNADIDMNLQLDVPPVLYHGHTPLFASLTQFLAFPRGMRPIISNFPLKWCMCLLSRMEEKGGVKHLPLDILMFLKSGLIIRNLDQNLPRCWFSRSHWVTIGTWIMSIKLISG